MNTNDQYKADTIHDEKYNLPAAHSNGADSEALDQIEEKKLVRKVDWRLLPILGALYSIALIDRTNVTTPKILAQGK